MEMRALFTTSVLLILMGFCSSCTRVFYQPDRFIYFPPERNGYAPKDIFFKSGDGTFLHGWFFEGSKPAKGTIVQFHGNAENITSHYSSLVWLTREGYNLFTFDYRGYGKSEGVATQEGLYKDGMAALDEAWKLHKQSKAKKFILYGQSLGGAVLMRSFADFQHQDETTLIVADSTFSSYQRVARQKLAGFFLTWPFQPLAWVLVSDQFSSEDVISKVRVPLLVIHDHDDPVVPFSNGKKIYELAQKSHVSGAFWELNKGRHVGVFALDTSENRKKFLNYLSGL
jgi:fermentation-respiration switch protein FrsA (DUF1100 family)